MRIRKNTKLSSILMGISGERAESSYVCHLNQSPWDVIPITSSSDGSVKFNNLLVDSSWLVPSSPSLIRQSTEFDGEDSFNGDVDANVRFEMNLTSPDNSEPMDISDDNSVEKFKSVEVTMPAPPKRGRPRGTAKKAQASVAVSNNPNEFYYYSGFGPRWGRKRGDEKICNEKSSSSSDEEEEEDDKTTAFRSGSCSLDDRFDYGDDDDVMNHQKKKRGRKPVKERSLKSLM